MIGFECQGIQVTPFVRILRTYKAYLGVEGFVVGPQDYTL